MGGNKFLDGVLWGVLIGGSAVFLFGTKKGNKLLDIIAQEGTEGLNKVLEEIEAEVEDIEDESLLDTKNDNKETVRDIIEEKFEKNSESHIHEKPKIRRFFSSKKKLL